VFRVRRHALLLSIELVTDVNKQQWQVPLDVTKIICLLLD